jgi:glyoxylase-like metal-dependent hydrolase (beta-lactamase superfamily II)
MLLPLLLAALLAADDAPRAPPAREIAPGVTLLPGAILPGRGPDGNTVIFEGRDGLVVVDTGRHVWHSDAILAFAAAEREPIAAIINTHWHLDHASGNRRLRAIYPNAPVFTTNAIDRALSPEGFLTLNRNEAQLRAMLDDPEVSELRKEEIRNGIATMDARDTLRPTVSMQRDGRYHFGGRWLDVHITDGAVTDADIWLYDRRTRVAVLGDLVTFPAPFFESACPNAWRRALDAVWATPFRIAIPGHGEPMNRDQFNAYRAAFNGFVDCVQTDAEAAQCASVWLDRAARFYATDEARAEAREYAEYYVGFLRANNGAGQTCLAN